MFEIEKNIPLPPPTRSPKARRRRKYPFYEMDIGDSFFVKCTKKDFKKKRNSIYASFRNYKMRANLPDSAVAIRFIDVGFRVWIIEKK